MQQEGPNKPTTSRYLVEGTDVVTGAKKPTSYCESYMHLVKSYVGTGVFALGQAFKFSGMILGPVALVIISMMNLHCQHILISACNKLIEEAATDVKPSFAEVVRYTFEDSKSAFFKRHSKCLGSVTTVFILLTEIGFCCVYFVFVGKHFTEVAHKFGWNTSEHVIMAILLGPMWLSTYLSNLKLLTPLSVIANLLMWVGMVMILYYTIVGIEPFSEHHHNMFSADLKLALYFGTALYSFEGITFIIPLRHEMRNPKRFNSAFGVMNTGIVTVTIMFCVVGILSYWKYGNDIQDSVFSNLPKEDDLAVATKILITLGVVCTYTLHMYIPFEISYPIFHQKFGPFKRPFLTKCIYRAVPVLVTYILANSIPFLGDFISLVGSSTASYLALILPPVIDLAAFGTASKARVVKNAVIITVGVVGALMGTVISLWHIIDKICVWIRTGKRSE